MLKSTLAFQGPDEIQIGKNFIFLQFKNILLPNVDLKKPRSVQWRVKEHQETLVCDIRPGRGEIPSAPGK